MTALIRRLANGYNIPIQVEDLYENAVGSEVEKYLNPRDPGQIVLTDNGRVLYDQGYCHIAGTPGQCGQCLLYKFEVDNNREMRNTLSRGESVAAWLGYTNILITLTSEMRIRAAKEYGFEEIDSFVNKRTNNKVVLLTKKVN